MAAAAAVPVHGIAWHIIGRKIIESDRYFNGGDYYDHHRAAARTAGRAHGRTHDLSLGTRRCRRSSAQASRQHAPVRDRLVLRISGKEIFAASTTRTRTSACRRRWTRWTLRNSTDRSRPPSGTSLAPALIVGFDTDWLFPIPDVRKLVGGIARTGSDRVPGNGHRERSRRFSDRLLPDHAAGSGVPGQICCELILYRNGKRYRNR